MKDKKTFGSFIKEKRIIKQYSQKDLADMLYVTESAVSKWERGVTYPDITLISALCKVLEVTEKELIESSDDTEYRKLKKDSEKYNRIKKALFWSLNIFYALGIFTCFIVNLAVSHTLSWFFIVLTSVLVTYSFCPTITWIWPKYKKIVFIGSNTISLFLLFLTCSIYSKNYWFMIPTISVILLYSIVFYPVLFKSQKNYLEEDKYNKLSKWFLFSYSLLILILIVLLLVFIYWYSPFNILLGFDISISCMLIPLIIGLLLALTSKRLIKILSISFVGLIFLMSIICLVNSVIINSNKEINTYKLEDIFEKIDIEVYSENINIYLTNGEEKIVYLNLKNYSLDTNIINGKLVIKRNDNRKFYEKIFNFSLLTIDLYLKDETIESLNIDNSTGRIMLDEGLFFNDVFINNSTGDIKIYSSIYDNLEISNITGDIYIKDIDELGIVNLKTRTGDIDIVNVMCESLNTKTGTGKTRLINTIVTNDFWMDGTTGDLLLDGFDASNIYVNLTTGNVTGTILTSKYFSANSNTGYVDVPKTFEGGECEIIVNTGDIKINYKE